MTSPVSSVGWRVSAVQSSDGAPAGGDGAWPASSSSWARTIRWASPGAMPAAGARGGGARAGTPPAGAQALGQGDGHGGLADPGRPEDSDDRKGGHGPAVSSKVMPVRIGTGLSTSPDARAGAVEASLAARRGLN